MKRVVTKEEWKELSIDQRTELVDGGYVFSVPVFFTRAAKRIQKICITREFIVFIIFTSMLFRNGSVDLLLYTIVSGMFIFVEALKIMLSKNTTVNLDGSARIGR
ncbi:MAG: hypothetical protein FWC97_00285 [Treponema sp.]|nr:hypothetical protein [Treponema sp.]